MTITTTTLPADQLGLPYNATLAATGGTPPYSWSFLFGGLPSGLSVSPAGVISGTPTSIGDNFFVQVTDANFPASQPASTVLFINSCNGSTNTASQGLTFEDSGGSGTLSVTVVPGCGPLTPAGTPPWLNITGNNAVDTINYSVAVNLTPSSRTGNVTFTYNSVSPVLVLSYSITQYARLQFSTPSPLPLGVVGSPYSVTLQATGGSGIGRTFSIPPGALPPGLSSAGPTISGTPASPGTFSFTAGVTDLDGFTSMPFSANQNYSITIAPPLSVTTTLLPGGFVGIAYSATLAAAGGIPPYTWAITSGVLPPGLLLNPTTGVISGTPGLNAQGTYPLTLRASDSVGLQSSAALQLRIDPPPLTIQTASLSPATEGVAYSAGFSATGGTPPYTWSASGLPSWLNLTSSGQLSGTPPAGSTGSYSLTINVQDSAARFSGVSIPLKVNPGPLVIVTKSPLSNAKEGAQFNIGFQSSGGIGPFTWSGIGLPGFLNLSSSGVLSGTPRVGSAGSYSLSITVTDTARSTASGTFSLTVDPLLAITTPSPLPQVTESQAYSATFGATGGTTPYAFSATGLPSWLTLSTGGMLNGTPPRGSAGGYSFTVTALDAAGHSISAPFTLVVLAPAGGLTIITTSPLPQATAGNYYQISLGATGGSTPYRWSGSGAPEGLTLSSGGLLSGTPATAGDYTVTAQVNDANGSVAFHALNLRVTPATLRITTPSPLALAEVSIAYLVAFQSDGGARPLVWTLSGPLPAGLTFDSTGLLSGTPASTGDIVFTVRVTDSTGVSTSAGYELLVKPFGPGLLLSAGGLTFKAIRGGATPPLQTVAVISSARDSVPFSADVSASWLTAASSGSTPGRIDVGVDQTGLAAGDYYGTISVTSPNRSTITVTVSLTVKEAPGILEALPAALQFFSDGTEQSSSQNIYVRNTGRGNLTFTASSDAAWLSVGPASGTVSPNLGAPLVATANLLGVAPGSYIATVEIDSAGGTARIPVSLLVSAKPKLVLSAAGVLFEARQGNGVSGASPVTFLVTSSNAATVHWNAQAIGGEGWLSLVSAQGTAKNSSPATVSFTVTSAGLQKGAYYALIRVTSPDVFNSPQDFEVVLNIVDAVATPVPDPVPAGLVFTSSGGASPPSQRVTVFTSSDQPAPYQIAISTETTQGWLSAAPLSGTISTNVPAQISVSVNAANLKPGVYRGSVNISISNLAVRTVGVTLIVIAPASEASLSAPLADSPKAGCSPANLVVTQTGLAGNFSTPAAWPRTVAVLLVDDCGNAISNGKIVAEFSNGDAPLSLNLSDSKSATYATTWTPVHATAQLTITAQATAPGLQPSSTRIVGAVSDTVAPILAKNGTLHNLYPQAGAPLAPGTIVQIFGSGLAASTGSTNIPLPTILNGTSVVIGGQLVPLYYVSSSQINAQLPVDLVPGQEYQVLVLANNAYTTPDTIRVAPATPGIARFANGQVIAQHADFTLVTQDSPAKPGEYLVAYLAGMGLTDTPVGTGAQAPSTPLAAVNLSAGVAIDGTSAPVLFAGLTPGFVGLYQVNFQVPAGTKSGNRKLEIVQAGQGANVSVLLVQ